MLHALLVKIGLEQTIDGILEAVFRRRQLDHAWGKWSLAPFGEVIALGPTNAFIDPRPDQSNLRRIQRLALGGHAFIGVFGGDELVKQAAGTVARLGSLEQCGTGIDRKLAFGLMPGMTAGTFVF